MGRGIALASLLAGQNIRLFDISDKVLNSAQAYIDSQIQKMSEKGKLSEEAAQKARQSAQYTSDISSLIPDANFIIEAIIEYPEPKQQLFESIENTGLMPDTILATNTSSLSVNVLSRGRKYPDRFVGLHFFNPAHLMKLVEIVKAASTSQDTIEKSTEWAVSLGKSPVIARDVPGFIVNRVARNYYNEAMRIATEGAASPLQIDNIMKSAGFKMGPFELMDLIGNDVNLEVTKSVAAQYFNEPRFTPSLMQQEIVNAGLYGRKTGAGFFDYSEKK